MVQKIGQHESQTSAAYKPIIKLVHCQKYHHHQY